MDQAGAHKTTMRWGVSPQDHHALGGLTRLSPRSPDLRLVHAKCHEIEEIVDEIVCWRHILERVVTRSRNGRLARKSLPRRKNGSFRRFLELATRGKQGCGADMHGWFRV
jgi:hypothetical protein